MSKSLPFDHFTALGGYSQFLQLPCNKMDPQNTLPRLRMEGRSGADALRYIKHHFSLHPGRPIVSYIACQLKNNSHGHQIRHSYRFSVLVGGC